MVGIRKEISTVLFVFISLSTNIRCSSQREPTPEQQTVLDSAKANLVFVEGGSFMMGKEGYPKANPVHKVTLDSYSMSKYETTFKEYDVYTQINNLDSIAPRWRNLDGMGLNYGVNVVTWQQARNYCQWLGEQLNLPIDLPTEAQWEYAARSRGLDVEHATNSGKIEGSYTEKRNYPVTDTIVGAYPPNPLGLYDMSGGRPEWVLDWYISYTSTDKVNPVQDTILYSKQKVTRGWHTLVSSVYKRGIEPPEKNSAGVGFRCVCNQKTPVE